MQTNISFIIQIALETYFYCSDASNKSSDTPNGSSDALNGSSDTPNGSSDALSKSSDAPNMSSDTSSMIVQ